MLASSRREPKDEWTRQPRRLKRQCSGKPNVDPDNALLNCLSQNRRRKRQTHPKGKTIPTCRKQKPHRIRRSTPSHWLRRKDSKAAHTANQPKVGKSLQR